MCIDPPKFIAPRSKYNIMRPCHKCKYQGGCLGKTYTLPTPNMTVISSSIKYIITIALEYIMSCTEIKICSVHSNVLNLFFRLHSVTPVQNIIYYNMSDVSPAVPYDNRTRLYYSCDEKLEIKNTKYLRLYRQYTISLVLVLFCPANCVVFICLFFFVPPVRNKEKEKKKSDVFQYTSRV